MKITYRCELCEGYGIHEDDWSRVCQECDGTGEIEEEVEDE